MTTTVYNVILRRWGRSEKEQLVRHGWGQTMPLTTVKGEVLETFELTDAEFAEWTAAKRKTESTLWDAWKRNK